MLRHRLESFTTDRVRSFDATRTLNDLAGWEGAHRHCYTVQAGQRLAARLHAVIDELRYYLDWLQRAGGELGADQGMSRARKWLTRLLVLLAVAGLIAGPVLRITEEVSTRMAVLIAVVPLLVLLIYVVAGFVETRREIFRDLHRRKKLLSEKQAVEANLRQTVIDAGRLTDAYAQYLVWSQVIGAVLDAPFGPQVPATTTGADITSGLPRTTRLARAQVDEHATGVAAAMLRRDVFNIGWLGRQWEVHVAGAGAQLGSYELTGRPDALLDLRGRVADSHLSRPGRTAGAFRDRARRGRQGVGAGTQVAPHIARAARHRPAPVGAADRAATAARRRPTRVPQRFDERDAAPGQEFAAEHFTADGRAERRNRIDVHWPAEERIGLSRVVVLVQLTEACDPWDFAVAARRTDRDGHRYEAPPGWLPGPVSEGTATAGTRRGRPARKDSGRAEHRAGGTTRVQLNLRDEHGTYRRGTGRGTGQ